MDSLVYQPKSTAHPGETIVDYLESFGWSQRELARRTGLTTKTISEICNGKASISVSTSIALERVFARPAHFWISLQSRFDEIQTRISESEQSLQWLDWLKEFPVSEMRKRGWISSEKRPSHATVFEILKFLGVSSPESWEAVWSSSKVAYRQTRKFKTSEHAISAWVRATEIAADRLSMKSYEEKTVINSLETIRKYTRLPIDQAFGEVQSLLAECGIAFVWIPALPKTGISGCTRWIGTKKVILAISLRYKTDDQIWFTFFHELGHILKHRRIEAFILDNADYNLTDNVVDPDMQKLEDEANRFAADTLIPASLLKRFLSFNIYNNEAIHEFADAIDIAPGIVIGRLQREGILKPHQGNQLKQRIDWSFSSDQE